MVAENNVWQNLKPLTPVSDGSIPKLQINHPSLHLTEPSTPPKNMKSGETTDCECTQSSFQKTLLPDSAIDPPLADPCFSSSRPSVHLLNHRPVGLPWRSPSAWGRLAPAVQCGRIYSSMLFPPITWARWIWVWLYAGSRKRNRSSSRDPYGPKIHWTILELQR